MHDYAVDTQIRQTAHVTIALIAMAIPAVAKWLGAQIGLPPELGFPLTFGTLFAVLFFLFDKYLWRLSSKFLPVPNLNGIWEATGRSSYEDPDTKQHFSYSMEVRIKQTFSKIEIFTKTADSTSTSTMASICVQHTVPILRYVFQNTPNNLSNVELHRHPGLVELRIESDDTMSGDYFSGKHRLRFGELTLRRR